jgi:nucleoside-diphosphate-sugar epimerase
MAASTGGHLSAGFHAATPCRGGAQKLKLYTYMLTRFTILGSRGYVGSHLAAHLRARPDALVHLDAEALPSGNLGHIMFCIGVTTDFASRLRDTMHAHVGKVMDALDSYEFDSFTYLSSTRVYERGTSGREDAPLSAEPAKLADFYKISKIAGEAVCLAHPRPTVRVARLSNVIGFEQPPLTFVPSLIRDALQQRRIVLNTALDSAKDYISMDDVLHALVNIALCGSGRIYNVSSGLQTTHLQIAECISKTLFSTFEVKPGGERTVFPETPSTKLQAEFGIEPQPILEKLPTLCRRYAAAHVSV